MTETFNNPGGATPDAMNTLASGQAARGPSNTRQRTVDNTSWGGMSNLGGGVNSAGRAVAGNTPVSGPFSGPRNAMPNITPGPGTNPSGPTSQPGGTGSSQLPVDPATGGGPVQQWKPPTAAQIAQGFTTAPDGPLAPEYQNMQANVQSAIAQNSKKPANFTIPTNDPNVWLSPEGGTWITPGYNAGGAGINSSQVYGTNPSLNMPVYNLPGGTYWQNPNTGGNSGAITQMNNPQQILDMMKTLPNRGGVGGTMSMLAGALNPDLPIRTSGDLSAATTWGNNLMNPQAPVDPATGSGSNSTNNQQVGPGGTQTPTTPANQLDANTTALLSALLGNGGGNILASIMNGTYKPPTPTPPANNQTQNTVMIGGIPNRWDPVNQYFVPINPIPYGQGGGEAT